MVGTVAISSLPILSTLRKKDRLQIEKTVGDSFSIAVLILLPSLAGMSLLAGPLYTLFFGYDPDSVAISNLPYSLHYSFHCSRFFRRCYNHLAII